MKIWGKLKRTLITLNTVLHRDGPLAAMECIVRHLGARLFGISRVGHPRINLLLYRVTDLVFDSLHHVDTGGFIDLPEMDGNGRNYVASPPRAWKLLMRHLAIDPSRFTYLDLGCGKGRTLLLASKMGFRRVIGLDISQQLLDVAFANAGRSGVKFELVCTDVRSFEFPQDPLVIFMYNPFFEEVMRKVAENLIHSLRQCPREVYVVYYSAALSEVWNFPEFHLLRSSSAVYPNYTIYGTSYGKHSLGPLPSAGSSASAHSLTGTYLSN
jgi:SAM-dependent methyltransferase